LRRHVDLSASDLAEIDKAFAPFTLPCRKFLLEAGQISTHEHYVVSGCLRTYLLDSTGNEHTLAFAIEDWWTGDLRSFNSRVPSYLYIEALEDTTLLRIERGVFDDLFAHVPLMDRFFRLLLARAFSASQERIYEEHALSVGERLMRCRKRYPWLEQRIPQKHIASYLGVTPEFLSRNRKKLLGLKS
jgi:CRP-like cAMP-binding protein